MFCFDLFFQARPPYQVEKKKEMGVPEVGVRRGSLDCLPVKFHDVKFKDPKIKHEIFMRIDMKDLGILSRIPKPKEQLEPEVVPESQ